MDGKEFIKSLDFIVAEKNISKDKVLDGMKLALATAYKKMYGKQNVKVTIDEVTGDIKIYSVKMVVDKIEDESDDEDIDEETEEDKQEEKEVEITEPILLEDARKIDPTINVGEILQEEVTPKDFGRVATSTAKQVLTQKIREAERESILDEYKDKQDELMVGILSMEDSMNYYVDLGRTRGVLPKKELIPGEKLTMGSSVKVYVSKIEATTKGPLILLSRSHYGFVKRLLELEIPELNDGTIMLYSVARDAGSRSKIAVYSSNSRIDAIGSCIGEKGSRINNIIKELNGEKIDIVLYSKDLAEFVKNALSPATDITVVIDEDGKNTSALAIVSDDQLSLAIGKKGQNIKLASRLTKCKIEVKSRSDAASMGINIK